MPNKLSQISSLLFQTETKVSKGFEKEQVCDIAEWGARDSTIVAFRYMAYRDCLFVCFLSQNFLTSLFFVCDVVQDLRHKIEMIT